MFHTLFDYQDQNIPNNRQNKKKRSQGFLYKSSKENPINYYGKENYNYEINNKNNNQNYNDQSNEGDYNQQFEQTKNKVKVIVYKNGFILDNGPFRDSFIPKNKEFLEQIARGVIPHELVEKGISDLGIYLINRKNETYRQKGKNNNSFSNFDFFKSPNMVSQQNQYKAPKKIANNLIPLGLTRIYSSKDIKKKSKNIEINHKSLTRDSCSEPKNDEQKKKFTAFSGSGKLVRNVSTKGLRVNKSIKPNIDYYQPICEVSIRLFNGDIANCQFNYSQTLRDIYYHVRRISGSNNFYLLDGFPPRPLRDYDRTIYELRLQNSLLTQKIN